MRAMILAAGRGERLRPLTDQCPKPLLEVGGKALIVHHLEHLASAGFEKTVINLGWLGEQIEAALGDGQAYGLKIVYSREPPGALETAGGIIQALPLLGDDPFAVISGDVLCDFPLESLRRRQLQGLAHLVMVDNPKHHPQGDFSLIDGRLTDTGGQGLTFSGIGLLSPSLFAGLTPGRRALRPVFEKALSKGQLEGEHFRGFWSDIGTPERLAEAQHSPMVNK